MRGLGKYLLFGLMVMMLTACPPKCEMRYIDFGKVPAEASAMVPYEDGGSYGFRHSGGKEIYFHTVRDTSTIIDHWDDCTQLSYGSDHVQMTADYPIFHISFRIYKNDSTSVYFHASIGDASYALPLMEDYQPDRSTFYDSLYLMEQWFHQVFKVVPVFSTQAKPEDILADTMWYNSEFGILKFNMSSEEFFEFIP